MLGSQDNVLELNGISECSYKVLFMCVKLYDMPESQRRCDSAAAPPARLVHWGLLAFNNNSEKLKSMYIMTAADHMNLEHVFLWILASTSMNQLLIPSKYWYRCLSLTVWYGETFLSISFQGHLLLRANVGALQLQEEACRQTSKDGWTTERDVDLQMRMNKDLMMSSLWKLNVVDIEVTLLHVCELVLHENNVKKEEIKAHAMALKILGKIFQRKKEALLGPLKKSILNDNSSSDEDVARTVPYWTLLLLRELEGYSDAYATRHMMWMMTSNPTNKGCR